MQNYLLVSQCLPLSAACLSCCNEGIWMISCPGARTQRCSHPCVRHADGKHLTNKSNQQKEDDRLVCGPTGSDRDTVGS